MLADWRAAIQSPPLRRSDEPSLGRFIFGQNVKMQPRGKYARIERERRFLLNYFPDDARVERVRRIHDRYIDGTTLRLRQQSDDSGSMVFKLTQKIPARSSGARQGFITTMYLTEDEYGVLSKLPAKALRKTRYSVPPFGIDIFEGALKGLLLAEAEFDSAATADALAIPGFISREVSSDDRFTGGQLASASREDVRTWLLEYGVAIERGIRNASSALEIPGITRKAAGRKPAGRS